MQRANARRRRLRRSERPFRAFFDRTGVGAALLSPDARLLQVNDAFCAITGQSREELLATDFVALPHLDDTARMRELLGELIGGRRQSFVVDVRRFHKRGSLVWVRTTISLTSDAAGRPLHLVAISEEVSAEHNAQALAEGQQRALELAVSEAPLGVVLGALVRTAEARFDGGASVAVFLVDPEARRFHIGAAVCVPRAYTRAVEGMALGPESIWCVAAAYDGRLTVVSDVTVEERWAAYRELAVENGIRACCAFPIRSFGGPVLGTLAVYRSRPWTPQPSELSAGEQLADTAALLVDRRRASERRDRADEALRGSEQRFAAVFQQAAGGIACTDATGRFEMVNDRYCEIVGRTRAELLSLSIQEITHPEDLARNRPQLRSVVRGGAPFSFEQRYLRPDGSVAWVSQDASVIRDGAGKPRGVIAVCQDIQGRKLADALLLEQKRLLELVAAGRPLDECLVAVCAAVPRLSSRARACALLTEASRKTWDRCVAAGTPASFPGDLVRGAPIDELIADAGRSGEAVTCADIASDERWSPVWRQVCAAHGAAAAHITPVLGTDRSLLGILVLVFSESRGPTSHERRLAEVGAHVASIAIERDRTAQELRESRAQLAAELKVASDLHELNTRLLATPDVPTAAQQVLDAVLDFVGAEMGTVQVNDPVAGGLRIVAQRGFDLAALAGLPVIGPDYDSACGRALRMNARVIVRDFETATEFLSQREIAAKLGYRAEHSTPLRTRSGEIVGMLSVHFPRPHAPPARELRTIDLCVRPLAHLMERARGEEALRGHSAKFRTLVEGAPYGIALLDAELEVRQLNATGRRAFGEDWEPVGMTLGEALRVRLPRVEPERIEAVVAQFRRTLETGEPYSVPEWVVPLSEGSECWEWQINRIPLANGTYGVVVYFADVTVTVAARTVIAASEERFRSLVSVLTDVPWTMSAEGAFVTPQPAWSAFTGQTGEELRGFGWANALHPDDRDAIWKACTVNAPYEVGGRLWHAPTQQYRYFVARSTPLRNADGAVREWVGSCTDVTEQRLAERALKDANRRKDDFLAMLGHELRNPLGALQNAIMLASLDEARRENALEIARRQTAQLGHLIDDLLDVARITQGRITLHKQPVKLADVLERAAEECRASMNERGHRLIVVPPGEELRVDVDPARLGQVVGNLLANAARYTESGGTVKLVGERDGSEAVIRVKDDGIGIAPELLSEIFEPFAQVDRGSRRSEGGLGIGLNVVQQLVQLHGGRVKALSDGIGRGAEFIVWLPLLAPAERTEAKQRRAPRAAPVRARVLVVDDNRDAAASIGMLLEFMGHAVRIAHDGVEAVAVAKAEAPALMLVDIGLPGMDGYEVARCIRREPALRGTRLVALTGYGREDDKQRAQAAGFDHHLVKPAELDTLREVVGRLVGPEGQLTPG